MRHNVNVSATVDTMETNPDRLRQAVTDYLNRAPVAVSNLEVTISPSDGTAATSAAPAPEYVRVTTTALVPAHEFSSVDNAADEARQFLSSAVSGVRLADLHVSAERTTDQPSS